jgi:hypothetical protein
VEIRTSFLTMIKRILIAALLWPLVALAQSYPSPTFQNVTVLGTLNQAGGIPPANLSPQAANTVLGNATGSSASPTAIPVTGCNGAAQALQWTNGSGFGCNSNIATSGANSNITSLSGLTTPLAVGSGGTGRSTASGTSLDNITGFAGTGFLTRTGAGAYAFQSLTNGITLGNLAQQAANTVLANATGSTGNVTAFTMPGCNSSTSALTWIAGSGFGCDSNLANTTIANTFSANQVLQFPNASTQRALSWYNASSPRWAMLNDGASETGGNVGSSFVLSRYSDAGAFIDNPIIVNRSNGIVSMNDGLLVPNTFVTSNSGSLSGAGITPYAYGAAGNGSTDDTTALQNWVNALVTNAWEGFCATGTYKVTKTINLTGLATKIRGSGGSSCSFVPALPAAGTVSGTAAGASYGGGATSIRLTVNTTTGMNGAIEVTGVNGTTEANGAWPIAVIDSTHVDIIGPTFAHAWTSGGFTITPVFAMVPTSAGGAAQPTLDMSGVYFGAPTVNGTATDVIIVTGGAFNSAGSNFYFHNNVVNGGYRRGILFWQSYAPILRDNYFFNILGAAVVANQDTSFSNGLLEHNEFFSNGNSALEAATILGGPAWVENPTILNNQWSGNDIGLLFAGNVNGAIVHGNYIENNTINFYCQGANNNGASIVGNWFNVNSGTQTTNITACTNAVVSNNWLSNQVLQLGSGSVVLGATNTLSGTGSITYPSSTPSTLINSTVSAQAISNATATNVTSLSVPSGNWECAGSTLTHPAAATTQSLNVTSLSLVSNSFPTAAPGEVTQGSAVSANTFIGQATGPVFYSFGGTTTLYLTAQVNYAGGTLTIDGDIHCHRIF